MNKNKKHRKLLFKNTTVRVFFIQFLVIFGLIISDLFVFKGYYTSKVIVQSEYKGNSEDYSCEFNIKKGIGDKYIFTFKNYSLFPKYFLNYRDDELFQNITDSIFFDYLGGNLFPAYATDYSLNFDCGTGLGLTSINPLESFEIEKTYKEIIEEFSTLDMLAKTTYLSERTPAEKPFYEFKNNEIDSFIKSESRHVLTTDSVQVEYYISMYSFVSKDKIYTVSNRINVSMIDLISEYLIRKNRYN